MAVERPAKPVPAVQPKVKAAPKPVQPAVKASSKPVTPTVQPAKPVKAARTVPVKPAPAKAPARRRVPPPDPAVYAAKRAARAAAKDATTRSAPRRRALDAALPTPEKVAPPPPDAVPPVVEEPSPSVAPPPSVWADAETVGTADERHPDEPVLALPPRAPGVLDDLFEPSQDDGRWPLPIRLARGDWRPALQAALPAALAVVLFAALGSVTAAIGTTPDGDLVHDLGLARWLRYVAAVVGLAFGSPLSAEVEAGEETVTQGFSVLFVPLAVTALGLVALWVAARRAHRRTLTPDRGADAVRTAAVFALGVAAVSWFGRWSLVDTQEETPFGEAGTVSTTYATTPAKTLFWAFLLAALVTWLASSPLRLGERAQAWRLAVRGALAGLGAGIAAGFAVLVALGYVYAGRAGSDAGDISRALPAALGYAVNLGAAVLGLASGGELRLPSGDAETVSLWGTRLPDRYLLLLLLPAAAAAVGAWYVTRHAPGRAVALRACGLMAYPAALAWLGIAVAGSLRFGGFQQLGQGFYGGAFSVGPRLWDALLVGAWFAVAGWLAGRVFVARRAFDPPEGAPVP